MDHVVTESKILRYLLTNPRKRGFFLALGYSAEHWTQLRDDLLGIAARNPQRLRRRTPHGDEYEIVGEVRAPNRKMVKLRTGWMVRDSEPGTMLFVTAYPA